MGPGGAGTGALAVLCLAANNSAMSKPPRPLDSRVQIVTPENIAFDYVLAGPFRRLPAYLVDVAICAVLLVGGLFVFGFSSFYAIGSLGLGLWLILAFVLSWFYFGLFETFWNGQTPGKRLFGLRVLTVEGQPINALQAIVRNVLRNLDAMPMLPILPGYGMPFYMVGLLAMASNDRYQRLGDLACGTMVVAEQHGNLRGLAALEEREVVDFAQSLPVNFMATRGLAKALSAYVACRVRFSVARRFEIASALAEPLCVRFGLPMNTNPDLLLCAMYYRAFIADRPGDGPSRAEASSPVAAPVKVAAE